MVLFPLLLGDCEPSPGSFWAMVVPVPLLVEEWLPASGSFYDVVVLPALI